MSSQEIIKKLKLFQEASDIVSRAKSLTIVNNINELYELAKPQDPKSVSIVQYDIPGKDPVKEVYIHQVKNGILANYFDPYLRRRDPESMLIGDDLPTDKNKFSDKFDNPFSDLRKETFDWLKDQDLLVFGFIAGHEENGVQSMAIVPKNAAFFAFGLAELQGMVDLNKADSFEPKVFAYVAPPFRHTHFDGKQMVVHNRSEDMYEIFSYNLYPGPSAKKGVYGALIHFGEKEGWVTNHASVTQMITPYDNKVVIMHEGASGGGKSEMNEHMHRDEDGGFLFGENSVTGEKINLVIPKSCHIRPVTDDMALCHKNIQKGNGKLNVVDAEDGWFIRVDHITKYGVDPDMEALSIHPKTPLLFMNIDAPPDSTALLWDHIEDEPGKPCPNPRFIIPRKNVPEVQSRVVSVDIRSFGMRSPLCTKEQPSYGILGIFHVLPPAIAWLWRLVSPRGFANPSIITKEGLSSEGVGSYWPFATGKKVKQVNLLLKQMMENPKTQYVLCPIKHVGAWKVGFMPQWIMREYITRRGGIHFNEGELKVARCNLLGYSLEKLVVEGQRFSKKLLQVELQPEVGEEAYDQGAKELVDFFKQELKQYLTDDLDPLGRKIIEHFLNDGEFEEYSKFIENESIFVEE